MALGFSRNLVLAKLSENKVSTMLQVIREVYPSIHFTQTKRICGITGKGHTPFSSAVFFFLSFYQFLVLFVNVAVLPFSKKLI